MNKKVSKNDRSDPKYNSWKNDDDLQKIIKIAQCIWALMKNGVENICDIPEYKKNDCNANKNDDKKNDDKKNDDKKNDNERNDDEKNDEQNNDNNKNDDQKNDINKDDDLKNDVNENDDLKNDDNANEDMKNDDNNNDHRDEGIQFEWEEFQFSRNLQLAKYKSEEGSPQAFDDQQIDYNIAFSPLPDDESIDNVIPEGYHSNEFYSKEGD